MLGFNCFASTQFLRNIFKHGYLYFTESRPPEKVTEPSSTHYKPQRTTSEFFAYKRVYLGAKKYLGVDIKITCKYKEGGFGRGIEGGKKLKCRAFNAHGSQSESDKVPWDLLQV